MAEQAHTHGNFLTRAWDAIKPHPYLIGLGVFGLGLLLLFLFRSSSSSSSAVSQGGTIDPTAYAQAQLASQAALNQQATQLQIAQAQIGGAESIANLEAQAGAGTIAAQESIDLAAILAGSGIQSQSIAAATTLGLAGISGQIDLANIAATAQATQTQDLLNVISNQTSAQYSYLNNQLLSTQIQQQQSAVVNTVEQDYESYLGRTAEPAGLSYWTSQITGGQATASQVASDIANSPEAVNDQITNDYAKYLGRAPDAAGAAYWTNEVTSGAMTAAQVATAIAGSPEAQAKANAA
jgi:Domain of unknown function (DUF4214)